MEETVAILRAIQAVPLTPEVVKKDSHCTPVSAAQVYRLAAMDAILFRKERARHGSGRDADRERSRDRGGDRGSGRSRDGYSDRSRGRDSRERDRGRDSVDRGSERGSKRVSERGSERGSKRGSERGSERGRAPLLCTKTTPRILQRPACHCIQRVCRTCPDAALPAFLPYSAPPPTPVLQPPAPQAPLPPTPAAPLAPVAPLAPAPPSLPRLRTPHFLCSPACRC